jgi:hypothetical protein
VPDGEVPPVTGLGLAGDGGGGSTGAVGHLRV